MGTFSFASGAVLTAAQLNALAPTYVLKQATETVTNSAALQNDDELLVALSAGKTYLIKVSLIVGTSVATSDFKCAYTTSGTLSHVGSRSCHGPSISTTDQGASAAAATTVGVVRHSGGHGLGTAVSYGNDGAANTSAIDEEFVISGGASGGTLTLQWAQNTAAGATTASVIAGSYMIAQVIAA